MKKYLISVFIPYLLLYLSGCYSMQEVTKEEFSPAPDYPELYVKTKNKEYTFDEGNFIFNNDTICGEGKIKYINNHLEPYDGIRSIHDVEDIQTTKSGNILIVKTKDREFVFKNELSSYSIRNDTIYGKGQSRFRYNKNQFQGNISLNDVEEIQVNQFNLGATIALVSILVLSVAIIVGTISSFKLENEDVWREIANDH
jgi:hypothetical protein